MEQLTPLGAAFHFTPQDLRANRQGELSPAQRRTLWSRFVLTILGGGLLVLVPILVTWGLIMWAAQQNLNTTLSDNRALIGYLIAGMLGLIYFAANAQAVLLALDLWRGQTQAVVAPVKIWGGYLLMGKQRFLLDDDLDLSLIKSGLTYRAFILPLSQTLLSLEFAE